MHFSLILIARPDQRIDAMMEPFYESWDEDDPRTVEGVDEDGDTYFYNPDAMWDWYEVGGRWTGLIEADGRVDCARVSTIDNIDPNRVHDVLTPDGVWHESETFHYDMIDKSGLPGVFVKDETFRTDFKERFLDPYPDCIAWVIDYHD